MKLDDMVLVSVDDHVVEPPDLFDGRLPARYQDRAPHIVKSAAGDDLWAFEGQKLPNIGLNAVVGRPPEEYGVEPTSFAQMRPGCFDVDARIGDMNANGVLASMCFASFPSFAGKLWAACPDKDLGLAMLRAYNDWHVDEWCGAHPGRFIPLGQVPLWDAKLAADEVRRLSKKGCHAIAFLDNPTVMQLPSLHDPAWNPLWDACTDEGTVVCIHIGAGKGMQFSSMDAPVDVMITCSPISIFETAADLVFSPFLRARPGLRVALSEGGIGWIPYFLDRIDYVYEHHHRWTNQRFGGKLPSEIFREHILTCFIDDPVGVGLREKIGVENICWECDYPHSDSTWPTAPERLWRSVEGLPDADIDAITHGNALREFRSDAIERAGGREHCTVAALRAQARDVDLSPIEGAGGRPPTDGEPRPVTALDITRQLATALDG
jgi:predicted TIM-barrel fold metal-dependent hydrolase